MNDKGKLFDYEYFEEAFKNINNKSSYSTETFIKNLTSGNNYWDKKTRNFFRTLYKSIAFKDFELTSKIITDVKPKMTKQDYIELTLDTDTFDVNILVYGGVGIFLIILSMFSELNYAFNMSISFLTIISLFLVPLVGTIYSLYLRITSYTVIVIRNKKKAINKSNLLVMMELTAALTDLLIYSYWFVLTIKSIKHTTVNLGQYTNIINTGIKAMTGYSILFTLLSIVMIIPLNECFPFVLEVVKECSHFGLEVVKTYTIGTILGIFGTILITVGVYSFIKSPTITTVAIEFISLIGIVISWLIWLWYVAIIEPKKNK